MGKMHPLEAAYVKASAKAGLLWEPIMPGQGARTDTSENFPKLLDAGFKSHRDATSCIRAGYLLRDGELDTYFDVAREEAKQITLGGAEHAWRSHRDDDIPAKEWLDNTLMLGDFREADIPPNSIDLILTDPPYGEEALPLFEALSEKAAEWLVPGGWCVTYAGQWALPRVMKALGKHLSYFWTAAILHSGDKTYMRKHHIENGWKPVPIFHKPPLDVAWAKMNDLQSSEFYVSGGQEKEFHLWQQAVGEAEYLLRHFCRSGAVVADPMCGSGTTLVAAKRLGHRYIGIDIDRQALASATERLAE
jgi:hypothetical protein